MNEMLITLFVLLLFLAGVTPDKATLRNYRHF